MSKHSKLLILDSDRVSLRTLQEEADPWYDVMATSDITAYNRWVDDQQTLAMVIIDLSVITADGCKLLERIRTTKPATRRCVTASLDNLQPIMAALHSNLIHSVLARPVNRIEVRALIAPPSAASQVEQMKRKTG